MIKSTLSAEKSCLTAALACAVFLRGTSMLMNLKLGAPAGSDPKIATQSSKAIWLDFIPERPSPESRPVVGKPEPTTSCLPTVGLVCEAIVVTVVVSVVAVGETLGERRENPPA